MGGRLDTGRRAFLARQSCPRRLSPWLWLLRLCRRRSAQARAGGLCFGLLLFGFLPTRSSQSGPGGFVQRVVRTNLRLRRLRQTCATCLGGRRRYARWSIGLRALLQRVLLGCGLRFDIRQLPSAGLRRFALDVGRRRVLVDVDQSLRQYAGPLRFAVVELSSHRLSPVCQWEGRGQHAGAHDGTAISAAFSIGHRIPSRWMPGRRGKPLIKSYERTSPWPIRVNPLLAASYFCSPAGTSAEYLSQGRCFRTLAMAAGRPA